jgi:hypothetical protein
MRNTASRICASGHDVGDLIRNVAWADPLYEQQEKAVDEDYKPVQSSDPKIPSELVTESDEMDQQKGTRIRRSQCLLPLPCP